METAEPFHPYWRYATTVMIAWCVAVGIWLGLEVYEQHTITSDVRTVQVARGRELERARERLAAGGEETALYLLQELWQSEAREKSIRPIVAIEKVIRGHAWKVGTLQRWSLQSWLEERRAGNEGGADAEPGAGVITGLIERALAAIRSAERQKESPFDVSDEELAAFRSLAEKRRLALWVRRRELAEALAITMVRMSRDGDTAGRLVLHGLAELLGDESPAVRRSVSRAAAAAGDPIIPWLIKTVEHEHVQPLMIVATSDYTEEENEERLAAENGRRRLEAVKLLGELRSPRADAIVERYAKDPVVGAEARRILGARATDRR